MKPISGTSKGKDVERCIYASATGARGEGAGRGPVERQEAEERRRGEGEDESAL